MHTFALAIVLSLMVSSASEAQVGNEIRSLVAASGTAELQMAAPWSSTPPLSQADVDVDSIGIVGSIALWRATLNNVDHWHWYLLAANGGIVYRLGGFQAPELLAVDAAVGDAGATSLWARSALLARLADPEGAINVVREGEAGRRPDGDSAMVKWQLFRPKSWPRDTVVRFDGGSALVKITVLSERTKAITPVWVPSLYVFLYDASRHLVAWSRLEGEAFGRRQRTYP